MPPPQSTGGEDTFGGGGRRGLAYIYIYIYIYRDDGKRLKGVANLQVLGLQNGVEEVQKTL